MSVVIIIIYECEIGTQVHEERIIIITHKKDRQRVQVTSTSRIETKNKRIKTIQYSLNSAFNNSLGQYFYEQFIKSA